MNLLNILTSKFLRYLFIGFCNTSLCILIMYLGAMMEFDYLLYTALGYLITITFSFFMNLHFTFKVHGQILKRLSLFFIVSLTNLLIVEIIEYILIELFACKPPLAILCGMLWYLISGFLINNKIVYQNDLQVLYEKHPSLR